MPSPSLLQMFCEESGNEARTLWERVKRKDDRTWVDFTPVTGRTHQVHAILLLRAGHEAMRLVVPNLVLCDPFTGPT